MATTDKKATERGKKVTIPARVVTRRPKPKEPAFLRSKSESKREAGFESMMSKWELFVKTPLTYVPEEDLERLLERETKSRKRWAIVNRLHSALHNKRGRRERAEYRKLCGL